MRHRIGGRQFGLPSDQRRALLKALVRSLFISHKITTTDTRAKDVKIIAERLITQAKNRNDLHGRRQANRYLTSETLVHHLYTVIAPEFKDVHGGYTRITHVGIRRGDAAKLVVLELATDADLGSPVAPEKIGTAKSNSI
ncbi:MAG: 50S ribosomal protein L17 [Capsulimonadaceae bacterium]|nr:50S ribosomal protein L17 [Capsulimonadaceae bacterium]